MFGVVMDTQNGLPTPRAPDDASSALATPSVAILKRRLGPSPIPRMLTPFEIELLRRSKAEIACVVRAVLTNPHQ